MTSLQLVLSGWSSFLREKLIRPENVAITLTFTAHDDYMKWECFMQNWMADMGVTPLSHHLSTMREFRLMGIPFKIEYRPA